MTISAADQQLIDTYLDASWMEKGLSIHTLDAYRPDLSAFSAWLTRQGQLLRSARGADVQLYLAHRFEERSSR